MSDILQDFTLRFITDDVSDGRGSEYRCSVYDEDSNLIGEAWADNHAEAMLEAIADWQRN